MTLLDVSRRQTVARIELENEPAFCGLGPSHAAVGMNNQAAFYSLGEKVGKVVQRREYLGTITAIKLNETQVRVRCEECVGAWGDGDKEGGGCSVWGK